MHTIRSLAVISAVFCVGFVQNAPTESKKQSFPKEKKCSQVKLLIDDTSGHIGCIVSCIAKRKGYTTGVQYDGQCICGRDKDEVGLIICQPAEKEGSGVSECKSWRYRLKDISPEHAFCSEECRKRDETFKSGASVNQECKCSTRSDEFVVIDCD